MSVKPRRSNPGVMANILLLKRWWYRDEVYSILAAKVFEGIAIQLIS